MIEGGKEKNNNVQTGKVYENDASILEVQFGQPT